MELEEGDIVLCTVDRIAGTVVFVKTDGTNKEGSIILSEIAPGRIRNLRDYVVPKKQIVCKILKIAGDRIHLSLRRVTPKEKKEVLEQHKQEKSSKSILKTILGEKTEEIVEKIQKEDNLTEYLQKAKEDSKKLEKLVGKKDTEKIIKILNTQKQKIATTKKEVNVKTTESNGITLIKNLLSNTKDAEIKYVSAGKYSIKTQDKNIKSASNKLRQILQELEKKAKQSKIEFDVGK